MEEKTILITGANDGIGRATAERLAGHGAHLVLACRDEVKAQRAAQAITEKTGNHRIDTLPLDLSSFSSIRAAADEFLAEHPKLDVLINNAGVYTDSLELTVDGYELQFGVNHLGHFLLTMALMPAIRCCRHCSRVINVSSSLHTKGGLDFGSFRGEPGDYLAHSPEVQDVSGRYFDEKQCLRKPSSIARNKQLARRLWEFSEKAVEGYLPKEQY